MGNRPVGDDRDPRRESQLDLKPQPLPDGLPPAYFIRAVSKGRTDIVRTKVPFRSHLWKVGVFSFLAALAAYGPLQWSVNRAALWFALFLVILVVGIGVVFDMIGVAVTVADAAPFHARSSRRRPGARQALRLLRNADKVANFTSDVVGDLSGTISGAAAAAIALRLAGPGQAFWSAAVAVSLVSAVTVLAKAVGKRIAIRDADPLVQAVGRLLQVLEEGLHWHPFHERTVKRLPVRRGRPAKGRGPKPKGG